MCPNWAYFKHTGTHIECRKACSNARRLNSSQRVGPIWLSNAAVIPNDRDVPETFIRTSRPGAIICKEPQLNV